MQLDGAADHFQGEDMSIDAKSLYDLSVNTEKAFALSQLLKAQLHLIQQDSSQTLALGWDWIFKSFNITPPAGNLLKTNQEESKDFCHADAYTLTDCLTYEPAHKYSIAGCLNQAQNMAEKAKKNLNTSILTQLNHTIDYVKQNPMQSIWPRKAPEFYNGLMNRIYLFYGLSENSLYRGEAFAFLQLGRFMEKFERTITLLQIHAREISGWKDLDKELSCLLAYCGAVDFYQQAHGSNMSIQKVFDFIIRDFRTVNSLHFCLLQIENAVQNLHAKSSTVDIQANAPIKKLKNIVFYPKKGALDPFLKSIKTTFSELKENIYDNCFRFSDVSD